MKKFLVILISLTLLMNTMVFAAASPISVVRNQSLMEQYSPIVIQAKVSSIGSLQNGVRTCKFKIVASYDRVWNSLTLSLAVPSNVASRLKKNGTVMLYLIEPAADQYELVPSADAIVTNSKDINAVHKELIKYRNYITKKELENNEKRYWLDSLVNQLSYFSHDNDLRYTEFYAGHLIDSKGRPTMYYRKEMSRRESKKTVIALDSKANTLRWVAVKYSYNQLASVCKQLENWIKWNPNVLGFNVNFTVNTLSNKVTVYLSGYSTARVETFKTTVFDSDILEFADLTTMVNLK